MAVDSDPSLVPDSASGDDLLLCPNCGYDLRGVSADRCSECGTAIDRAALLVSNFPWAHRRERGRIGAYIHTVWLVCLNSRLLKYEAAKPQDLASAQRFQRITGAILSILLVGLFITAVVQHGTHFLILSSPPAFASFPPPYTSDLLAPWSAGATLPWLLPAILTAFSIYMTQIHRLLFRIKGASPGRQERAYAIACYASASLALLLPLALAAIALSLAIDTLFFFWIPFVGFILAIGSIVRWIGRVKHTGAEHALLTVPCLLGLWILGGIALLIFIPWAIGFVWIVVDSFL